MAGTSLLVLIDDIASMLDDVAAMTKIATRKTVGLLGDDLALNAEQVSGVNADRELPVVWAVAKGSLLNKLILVPSALGVSAVAPWAIAPVLMVGGAYLCYEGFEKISHKFLSQRKEEDRVHHEEIIQALSDPDVDVLEFEKKKIRGAIRTDFILSAEIIVIALGAVASADFPTQAIVVSLIALLMTVGVYSAVAGIVKLDDAGLYLMNDRREGLGGRLRRWLGKRILLLAPSLMKTLSVVGTAAMFLVGGGILVHGLPLLHSVLHPVMHHLQDSPGLLSVLAPALIAIGPALFNALVGLVVGAVLLMGISLIKPQD